MIIPPIGRVKRHRRVKDVIGLLRSDSAVPLLFEKLSIGLPIFNHLLQQSVQLVLQPVRPIHRELPLQFRKFFLQFLQLTRRNILQISVVRLVVVLCLSPVPPVLRSLALVIFLILVSFLHETVLQFPLEPLQTVRSVTVLHFSGNRVFGDKAFRGMFARRLHLKVVVGVQNGPLFATRHDYIFNKQTLGKLLDYTSSGITHCKIFATLPHG